MDKVEVINSHKKDSPLVSIVLPVYNVEKYLHQSLDSVVNQTYTNLEIICVDDGSTDKSLAILEEYKKNDPRIQILSQDNQGAGFARNAGMDLATGKYIIFWDPDDYFDLNAIKTLVEKAETENSDVCCCDAQTFESETGEQIYHPYIVPPFPKKSPFSWHDCPNWIFFIASSVPWNKLVRLSLLRDNNIRFPSFRNMEDNLYMFLVMCYAERISICKKRLIHYRADRPGSLVQAKDTSAINAVSVFNEFYEEMNTRGLLEDDDLRNCFFKKAASMYHYRIRYCPTYSDYENYYSHFNSSESATVDCNSGDISRIDKMRELSAGDYLLDSYKILLHKEKETQQKLLESRERASLLKKECASLSNSNQALKERIRELEERMSEQDKRIREAEDKLKRIKSSHSYRIGYSVTYFPRQIKKKMTKR